jgi:hypothetical protein
VLFFFCLGAVAATGFSKHALPMALANTKPKSGRRQRQRVAVAVMFFCVICLFVAVLVLVLALVKEKQTAQLMTSGQNRAFWSQVQVPLTQTNLLFNGYEPVDFVCISMTHRKHSHFDVIQKKLKKDGLDVQWFKGLNGKRLQLDDYQLSAKYRTFFENNQKARDKKETTIDYRGHLGCTLSHLGVIASVQNLTVILEDDADPVPEFRTRFQNVLAALNQLDPTWELLLLGWCCEYRHHSYHKLLDSQPLHQGGLIKVPFWIGGWGYCIRNRQVAQKILGFFEPLDWHIDLTLAEQTRQGKLNTYGCLPALTPHAGKLRVSSFDYTQLGDTRLLKSDSNNEIPDDIPE